MALASPPQDSAVGDYVCDGGRDEDREARLKIGSGSLAAVERAGTNGMQNLGVGSLGFFRPFCPLTLPPPPTFSRWGGAEMWVRFDSCISPHALPPWVDCRAPVGK